MAYKGIFDVCIIVGYIYNGYRLWNVDKPKVVLF